METLTGQYGHDDSLFIAETQDFLHCGICTLVLRDPVMIICCGHKFCGVCFERVRNHSVTKNCEFRCPIDREVIDLSQVHQDVAMQRLIGSLLVRCPDHELGCQWTGDLHDMNVHHEACQYKPVNTGNTTTLLMNVQVKEFSDRLDRYEQLLFEKDKENALLKLEQLQLKDEIKVLKQKQQQQQQVQEQQQQQQEQESAALKLKIEMLEQKFSQQEEKYREAQEKLQEEQSQQQERQQSAVNELLLKVEALQMEPASCRKREQQVGSVDVVPNNSVTQKKIHLQHHCGDPKGIIISKEQNSIEFRGEDIATVSAMSVVVPPHTKVWYEVEYTHCNGLNIVGWATPDLPTSQTFVEEWVGKGTHSYGFSPFYADKEHNSHTPWGKKLTGGTGAVGVALDLVKGEILFSVGGQWTTPMGVAFTDVPTQKKFFPAITGDDSTLTFNFGDRAFKYGPPDTCFKALIDVL